MDVTIAHEKTTEKLLKINVTNQMVRPRRLELPRACAHNDLNVARLPIPPRPHAG
jgi:hypothetical protein